MGVWAAKFRRKEQTDESQNEHESWRSSRDRLRRTRKPADIRGVTNAIPASRKELRQFFSAPISGLSGDGGLGQGASF
jgi:hypothetical protein